MVIIIVIKNFLKIGEERRKSAFFMKIFKNRYGSIKNSMGEYTQLNNKTIGKGISTTYNIGQALENCEESFEYLEK